VEELQVVQVRTAERDGFTALQLGAGTAKEKNVNRPEKGHFRRAQVECKRKLAQFPVTADAVLPVGTTLHAAHFVPGQFVDVTGWSKGKGFAGVMKRWNFGGLRASHGVSAVHRSLGSTGTMDKSGVFKGKKMPGRLGNERVTTLAIQVYKIDRMRDLIYIVGTAPGAPGSWTLLRDSIRKPPTAQLALPFPTYFPTDADHALWDLDQREELSALERAIQRDQGADLPDEVPFEVVMPFPDLDPTVDRSVAGDEY
jgi:large subunit ribosomal protein L3